MIDESIEQIITRVVRQSNDAAPRSQQLEMGMSEIGHPCDRLVWMKSHYVQPHPGQRPDDLWLANIGTAVHEWLAFAMQAENVRLGRVRYLIEIEVMADDGTSGVIGHTDVFDCDTGTVWDFKVLGKTKLVEIRSGRISEVYRKQLHLNALGHEQTRHVRVEHVALVCLPRNDNIRGDFSGHGLVVHEEPYDRLLALAALSRYNRLRTLHAAPRDVPASPSSDCRYCPYYRPGHVVDDHGCPGPSVATATELSDFEV